MTVGSSSRVLVVIPGLPEQRSGGGMLLYELLAWLVTRDGPRGDVAAVMPVPESRRAELTALRHDPALAGVQWHPLDERRVPGVRGRIGRMLGPLPADMAKVATPANAAILEEVRSTFRPTAELAVSPADVASLDRLGGRADTVYLPPLMRPRTLDRSAVTPGGVLITTNLAYQPNVVSLEWFLRDV